MEPQRERILKCYTRYARCVLMQNLSPTAVCSGDRGHRVGRIGRVGRVGIFSRWRLLLRPRLLADEV